MCIAIIKNQGIQMPPQNVLEMCFKNNKDGAGFVVNRNGCNYIRKGFFTFKGLYEALKQTDIKKNQSALIHFRVATHGKVNIENCHPFPIQNNFNNMTIAHYVTNSPVMIHNGKLDIETYDKNYSDSMHLAKAIYNFDFHNEKFKDFLQFIIKPTEKSIKGNRIAIIDSDGNIEKYGVGWIQENGIFYSNDSFKQNSTYKKKKNNIITIYTNPLIGYL